MRLVPGSAACRIVWIALCLLACGPAAASPSGASEPALTAAQYQHTAWLAKDGAPAPIRAMAQTDDGYLWLGTEEGLYRFDGQSFDLIPTPGGPAKVKPYIGSLLAEPGGGLWVGFRRGGGLGYLKDGKFTRLEPTQKRDADFVSSDGHGGVWFQLGFDLYRLKAGKLEVIGAGWNLGEHVVYMLVDDKGNVWVDDAKGRLLELKYGASRFELVSEGMPLSGIALDGNGGIWGPGVMGMWHVDTTVERPKIVHGFQAEEFGTITFDRTGGLWVQRTGGIAREADPVAFFDPGAGPEVKREVFSLQQGLSSETVWAMLEDRDDNLWMATSKGLDRFRRTLLTPVKLPRQALSFITAPAEDGALWAANFQGGLMKVTHGQVQEFPSVGPRIRFIYRDLDGTLWVGGGKGLWRSRDGSTFEQIPVASEFVADSLRAVAVDTAHGLWISGGGANGVQHVVDGKWLTPSAADGFPANWNSNSLVNDGAGRIWGAYRDDVLVVENGKATRLSKMAPGLDIGRVSTMSVHGERVWLGGYTGVAVFDGHRIVNLTRADGVAFSNVGGLVELPNGDVWLQDRKNAMRIPAASIASALASPGRPVDVETFSEGDGLYGGVSATSPLPSLSVGSDGRLWFATDAGLAWLDPNHLERPARVPAVKIRTLLADGTSYPTNAPLVLPPHNQHTEISYAAIALSTPERVRFRYRLEGSGADWQDVGARRTAYFTNLAPGRYTFRVRSTDEYGAWHGNESLFEFQVGAAWYQTIWFRVLCVAGALLLLWSLVRLRVAQVSMQLLAREDARQVERNRIARDLHDTFLQSVQALMWQFHALSDQVSSDGRVQEQLHRVLELADKVLDEGRDRVIALRKGSVDGGSLSHDIEQAWKEITGSETDVLHLAVEGVTRPLREHAYREILQIAREALVNVHRHAQASKVAVTLAYERRCFTATIVDDGIGVPADVLQHGKQGHWGLAGMRERAVEMGATLHLRSDARKGTTVALTLKSSRAYAAQDDIATK